MSASETPPDIDTYRSFLRRVSFFRDLSDADVDDVATVCRKETVPASTVIFNEGDVADRFYIVMKGSVEVWKSWNDANRSLLARHGEGGFFGEMSLIDNLPRSASLVTAETCTFLSIGHQDFQRLLKSNSSLSLSLLLSVSSIVRTSNETYFKGLLEQNQRLERAFADLKSAQEEVLRTERLSTIGKFSSIVLHDIRNPIATIKALAELMAMHSGDKLALEKDIRRLKDEAERMERLTQEFLDYSRGEIRLSLGMLDTNRLFLRLHQDLDDRLARSSVKLDCSSTSDAPFVADEERFLRVFLNLIENSRKAMPSGGTIRLHVERREDLMHFSLKDEGTGMPIEVLCRIFEPFYSQSSGGTGLGMLIVKNIVEAHDGAIEVHSKPGAGTEVRIAIPARL